MDKAKIKKVVLAYSGGLDTSIIIPWLKENYNNPEIIAVSGNVGQADELEGLEEKALKTGASKLYIEDLTKEFLDDYVFPGVMAGAKYEDYLLGTAYARPPIAKRIAEIAAAVGAQKIVFITDVDGIYKSYPDESTLIGRMALAEAVELAEGGSMSSGMIPKINACVTALSAGVKKAHIINGTAPHSLVLEIFTVDGVGTMVMRQMGDDFDPEFVEAPVSNFASKLDSAIQTLGH